MGFAWYCMVLLGIARYCMVSQIISSQDLSPNNFFPSNRITFTKIELVSSQQLAQKLNSQKRKIFCCDTCYETYTDNGKKVSELVLNNSVEFTNHCKHLINKDRKTFLKYIKTK